MISFIRGLVADTTENAVILENNGIGYEIFMTGSSIEQVSRIDGEVKIHTYFQVREDAMQLYGFLSKDDLEMFRLLLNVNGIGPKAALGDRKMNCVLPFFLTISKPFPKHQESVKKLHRNLFSN